MPSKIASRVPQEQRCTGYTRGRYASYQRTTRTERNDQYLETTRTDTTILD